MKALAKELNERINKISIEDCKLMAYCMLFLLSWALDTLHNKLLANYYGCSIAQLLSYDRGGLLILLSLAFGIVNLILCYKIIKATYNAPIEITIVNHIPVKIKGAKRLLSGIAIYYLIISAISVLYDFYDIISSFI